LKTPHNNIKPVPYSIKKGSLALFLFTMWSNFTRKSFQFSSASSRTRKKVTSDKKPQSKQKGSSNPPKSAAGERRPKKAASANPDRRQAQEPNCMTRQYSTNTSHRHVQHRPDKMIKIRQDDDGSEARLDTQLAQLPASQHVRRKQKIPTRSQPGQIDMIKSMSNTKSSSMTRSFIVSIHIILHRAPYHLLRQAIVGFGVQINSNYF